MNHTGYQDVIHSLRERTGIRDGPLSLISFTIAGVQRFLDSARTTRDVWNGSYLLSYLTWKATEAALSEILSLTGSTHERGATGRFVLIPAIEVQPLWRRWAFGDAADVDVAQFPNSVLLVVPGGENQAREVARQMEGAVEQTWKKICQEAEAPLKSLLRSGTTARKLWDYQLAWRRTTNGRAWQQVFEVYTAVWELADALELEQAAQRLWLDPGRGPAGQLFELAMRLLTARKTLRDFEQFVHEGYRCSLCGERTALAEELSYEGVRRFWDQVRNCGHLKYLFRDPDRLCAVCTVRRLAPVYYFQKELSELKDRIWFPSTSTIAAACWVKQVVEQASTNPEVREAASRFPEVLGEWRAKHGIEDAAEALVPWFGRVADDLKGFVRCSGRWFYPETYLLEQSGQDSPVTSDSDAGSAPAPLALLKDLRSQVGSAPDDYFVVIMADGDHIGDWMSGQMDPERFDLRWQQEFSAALADFAAKARTSLEQWIPAKVVYAGGDDVLAFAPRRCLLEALAILDLTFDWCVRRKLGYRRDSSPTPTLSVGCVVAKHKDPLKGAIVRAQREVLKETAKEGLGRNVFAVYRTTGGVTVGAPFFDGQARTLPALRALLRAFRGGLSPRVRWELENLAEGMQNWSDERSLYAAQQALIRRCFRRHNAAPEGSKESEAVCRQAERLFDGLWRWSRSKLGTMGVDPLRAFLDLLGLLIFLARHES